jgi:hypothetical protein
MKFPDSSTHVSLQASHAGVFSFNTRGRGQHNISQEMMDFF